MIDLVDKKVLSELVNAIWFAKFYEEIIPLPHYNLLNGVSEWNFD